MIRVDSSFYESGCTMEGKGNRVFLKGTDGNVYIEMTFVGNIVKIGGRGSIPIKFEFNEIEEIYGVPGIDGSYPDFIC